MRTLKTSYKECTADVSYPEYKEIIAGLMQFISDKLLDGEHITLPADMGSLEIVGVKQEFRKGSDGKLRGLAPDWNATKKLWAVNPEAKENKKVVFHFNEHSSGIRYKVYWTKTTASILNKAMYTFVPVRSTKRKIKDRIIRDKKEYRIHYGKTKIRNRQKS